MIPVSAGGRKTHSSGEEARVGTAFRATNQGCGGEPFLLLGCRAQARVNRMQYAQSPY